jgi:hypothetical protein
MAAVKVEQASSLPTKAKALHMRAGQRQFFRLVDDYRLIAFLARRQYGKTTTFARIALKKMMKTKRHTVIFGSAKINLSREIVRAEAFIIQTAITEASSAALRIFDANTGKAPDKTLSTDDFAELFEAQRLEFRYYHDRTNYSRTKVVALTPDAVGETGDLMCDEIGRVRNWREVWEAVSPIIASNPAFRLTLATTIPPDDTHFSYEQLVPPVGTEFTPNAQGNLYESEMGIMVQRVDAWDAFADGVPVYDMKTGDPLDPDESRRREHDKDAWDRNYGLKFVVGGSSACGLMQLEVAQRRGVGTCAFFKIETDTEMQVALQWVTDNLSAKPVGIGIDPATTTKQKSNPTAVALVEDHVTEEIVRAIFVWKTADPKQADERIDLIVAAVAARKSGGGRARGMCIDATNERYWASATRDRLTADLPVELIVGSEAHDEPGMERMTMKQFLGNRLTGSLDDNKLTLPPDRYVREDFRLVKKDRGQLVCEPDIDGKHGDTFDAVKLASYALDAGGPAEASAAQVGSFATHSRKPEGFWKADHSSDT